MSFTVCPQCSSCDRVTRITAQHCKSHCASCGHRQTHLLYPAQPAHQTRRTHPHHYVAVMLAFFAIAIALLFVQTVSARIH